MLCVSLGPVCAFPWSPTHPIQTPCKVYSFLTSYNNFQANIFCYELNWQVIWYNPLLFVRFINLGFLLFFVLNKIPVHFTRKVMYYDYKS
jgi:hypothetical protein